MCFLPLQEIVFIGASMDRAAIELQLDSAMLTDAGGAGCGEVYVAGQESCNGGRDGCVQCWRSRLSSACAADFLVLPAEMETYRSNWAKQPDPQHPAYEALLGGSGAAVQ